MKKVLMVVLAIAMVFGLAAAQDVNPAIHQGAKSFNFTFAGLGVFGIGPVAIGPNGPLFGVGASYFLNNDAAVRGGLQLGIKSTSTPSNLANGGTDGSTSSFTAGVSADYLMYMNAGRVRPYWGAGINFTTTSFDNKPVDKAPYDEQKGGQPTTFGLTGIAGAEFFIYSEVSLSAEYQLNIISISSISDKQTTFGGTTITAKGGSSTNILGFNGGWLTLHIYM
jgi:opacity protein-like surface antigen